VITPEYSGVDGEGKVEYLFFPKIRQQIIWKYKIIRNFGNFLIIGNRKKILAILHGRNPIIGVFPLIWNFPIIKNFAIIEN
jgi:hypothetical protein